MSKTRTTTLGTIQWDPNLLCTWEEQEEALQESIARHRRSLEQQPNAPDSVRLHHQRSLERDQWRLSNRLLELELEFTLPNRVLPQEIPRRFEEDEHFFRWDTVNADLDDINREHPLFVVLGCLAQKFGPHPVRILLDKTNRQSGIICLLQADDVRDETRYLQTIGKWINIWLE